MSILVTGASGLLGSEMMKLNPGAIGISSSDCNLIESADIIRHFAKNQGVKTVIHCAAKVGGVKANTEFVADFFDSNMKMNMNVLNACKESGLKLVSVLSTCVYPDSEYVDYPLTEDQLHLGPPHHSNFGYAYAKRMLEVQSRAYRHQHGCNFITVIPNNLYGIEDNYDLNSGHVVPSLIRKFHEAKMRGVSVVKVWGSGKPLREFTFARDAAKIILWLSENYNEDVPINIGNTEQISIKQLAILISNIMQYRGEIVFDVSMPEGQYQKPSSNKRLKDMHHDVTYTNIEDALSETIQAFSSSYPHVRGI